MWRLMWYACFWVCLWCLLSRKLNAWKKTEFERSDRLFFSFSLSLAIHPCRDSVQTLLGRRVTTDIEHLAITLLLFVPILYFGATLTSLGSVFDIIGGFSTMVLGKGHHLVSQPTMSSLFSCRLLVTRCCFHSLIYRCAAGGWWILVIIANQRRHRLDLASFYLGYHPSPSQFPYHLLYTCWSLIDMHTIKHICMVFFDICYRS